MKLNLPRNLFFSFCIFLFCTQSSWAAKIINCPPITASNYGQKVYLDKANRQEWKLTWYQKNTPRWDGDSLSIPEVADCGKSTLKNGMPINYKCVVFHCASKVVDAELGKTTKIKCHSAFISTENNFYCEQTPAFVNFVARKMSYINHA